MQHRNAFKNLLSAILESGSIPIRPPEWVGGSLDDDTARQVARGYRLLWRFYPGDARPVFFCRLDLTSNSAVPDVPQWGAIVDGFFRGMGFPKDVPWAAYLHRNAPRGQVQIVVSRVDFLGDVVSVPIDTEWAHLQAVTLDLGARLGFSLIPSVVPPRQKPTSAPMSSATQGERKVRPKPIGQSEIYRIPRSESEPAPKKPRRIPLKERKKAAQKKLKPLIDAALQGRPTAVEFVNRLIHEGVSVKINLAHTGRLNGFQFGVDGVQLKASDLGRDYGWMALQASGVHYEKDRDFKRLWPYAQL